MKTETVTVVRVYCTERNGIKELLGYLHDHARVRGVTVFRGVMGFGASGTVHTSSLVDLAMDLPLVVEFFDSPPKVRSVLDQLSERVEPRHVLTWDASVLV